MSRTLNGRLLRVVLVGLRVLPNEQSNLEEQIGDDRDGDNHHQNRHPGNWIPVHHVSQDVHGACSSFLWIFFCAGQSAQGVGSETRLERRLPPVVRHPARTYLFSLSEHLGPENAYWSLERIAHRPGS